MADVELTTAADNAAPATTDLLATRKGAVAGLLKITYGALATFFRSLGFEAGANTAPTAASLAWINQGTSTATDGVGALIVRPQNAQARSLVLAIPAAPFSIYMRMTDDVLSTGAATTFLQTFTGIVFRNSANNRMVICGSHNQRISGDEQLVFPATISRWTGDGTAWTASPVEKFGVHQWHWFRVDGDNPLTTLTFYVSRDGKNWYSIGTETLAAHLLAVTHYGFSIYSEASNTETIAAISYLSTTAP